MSKKKSKKVPLSEGQERLLDIFASIERWTQRGDNHAFVFLCDGKDYMVFANNAEELSCNLPIAMCHVPKMAALFDSIADGVEMLTESMSEDIPEWKKEYESVQTMGDLPEYFFYGDAFDYKDEK